MTAQFPPDYIMREMSKFAYETATESLAAFADKFARELPPEISGADAMRAFAAAIRSTNEKRFPKETPQ